MRPEALRPPAPLILQSTNGMEAEMLATLYELQHKIEKDLLDPTLGIAEFVSLAEQRIDLDEMIRRAGGNSALMFIH